MTSKDLSIFNSLRPFSIGFDDMFDQFENMLGNGGLTMQSNYPPYNIRKTGKDNYAIEVALAGFNKDDVEVEFEDNLLTVRTKQVKNSENKNEEKVCEVFKTMEFKLYNYIMMPAMILSWLFGLVLITVIGFEQLASTWLKLKFFLVIILTAYHLSLIHI